MDEKYIVPHLKKLCDVMYRDGETFAKYSERRKKYIFGCIRPFGEVTKNIVDKSIAIFLIVGNFTKE